MEARGSLVVSPFAGDESALQSSISQAFRIAPLCKLHRETRTDYGFSSESVPNTFCFLPFVSSANCVQDHSAIYIAVHNTGPVPVLSFRIVHSGWRHRNASMFAAAQRGRVSLSQIQWATSGIILAILPMRFRIVCKLRKTQAARTVEFKTTGTTVSTSLDRKIETRPLFHLHRLSRFTRKIELHPIPHSDFMHMNNEVE